MGTIEDLKTMGISLRPDGSVSISNQDSLVVEPLVGFGKGDPLVPRKGYGDNTPAVVRITNVYDGSSALITRHKGEWIITLRQ